MRKSGLIHELQEYNDNRTNRICRGGDAPPVGYNLSSCCPAGAHWAPLRHHLLQQQNKIVIHAFALDVTPFMQHKQGCLKTKSLMRK